jgi:PIN domain nuclease of toxin-antitoxin system
MNVLLDTCALLALADGALPRSAASALRKAPEAVVSVVSPWEVAIKVAGGKLRLREPPVEWFRGLADRYDLREAPLEAGLACAAAALPPLHRDPFDRVIVALAHAHG